MILALWPPALQFQLPALFFVCVLFVLYLLFVDVLSGEPKQTKGEGRPTANSFNAHSPSPVIILLAVPRRLFWFGYFVIFRCGVLLFIVILVIYINK